MSVIGLLVSALLAAPLAALDTKPELPDREQQALYERMTREVRCLVCQNQPIADSNAPLAADLRAEIYEQIAAGRSEAEIHDFLLARYGDFVLYRPRFAANTAVLWLAPGLLLLLGSLGLWRIMQRRAALPMPGDEEDGYPPERDERRS